MKKDMICSIDMLSEKLLEIGLREITYNDFRDNKNYYCENDTDPRWKLDYKVYQVDSFITVIFIKNNLIIDSKSYGGWFPNGFNEIMELVEWHDGDYENDKY